MAGHTPGPWRHKLDHRGRHLILPADEPNIVLAEAFGQSMNLSARGKPMYPARENARLIAAAPKMFDALADLEIVLAHFAEASRGARRQACIETLRQIEETLREVEGSAS